MTWKLNHCPDCVLWSSETCHSLEEGSRSCNLERGPGPLTLGQPKLLYNTITNVGNQHLYIPHRTQHWDPDPCQGCGEQVMRLSCVRTILLSPPESEGEDCEEKSHKLQVKRVKAGLDTGIWALTQGLRTAGQYSVRKVSCNTWSVQTWPERQGPGRQLQSVLLVLETQSRARSLIQGPHREYWPG